MKRFLISMAVWYAHSAFSDETIDVARIGFEQEILDIVDPLVDQRLIPGYFLSIKKDGKTIFENTRGYADEDTGLIPAGNVLYAVASMTKPLTALATIQLIDQGKLDLEDPLSKFLPEFESMLVAQGGSYDSQLIPAESPILIKHLLTHTSGFTYSSTITGVGDVANAYKDLMIFTSDSSEDAVDLETQLSRLSELPLVAQPGTAYNYSVSFDVLSMVIEKVSGVPFADYMRVNIFEPLGMTDSHFFVPKGKFERLSRLYAPLTRTIQIPGTPKMYQKSNFIPKGVKNYGQNAKYVSGGASLLTTADDYHKFLSFLMKSNRSANLKLAPESINLLLDDQTVARFGHDMMVEAMGPQASSRTMSYGLGIKYEALDELEQKYDYHFWGGAFNTRFWFDIETGVSGVFMTQLFPTRYDVTGKLDEVADKYFSD